MKAGQTCYALQPKSVSASREKCFRNAAGDAGTPRSARNDKAVFARMNLSFRAEGENLGIESNGGYHLSVNKRGSGFILPRLISLSCPLALQIACRDGLHHAQWQGHIAPHTVEQTCVCLPHLVPAETRCLALCDQLVIAH